MGVSVFLGVRRFFALVVVVLGVPCLRLEIPRML